MPVLDARALETDPEGMALLADVLRPAKRARRRMAARRWPLPTTHEAPAMGRELVEHEPEEPREAPLVLTLAE